MSRAHDVPGGAGWSLPLRRDDALWLECLGDGANASMLIYAAADPLERLNVPDTLKAQLSGCVRPPMVLMSDLGRALCSVTESTVDWHDAVTGHGPDTTAPLLDELAVLGLGRRDLHATVNWFSKVVPADDERGSLAYRPGHARAGDRVCLRAEQDLLIVLCTAAHPMDRTGGEPAGVRATVGPAAPVDGSDPSWRLREESTRALERVA
jgi:hypothetical protein